MLKASAFRKLVICLTALIGAEATPLKPVACKEYGFEKPGFQEVYSIIRDRNIPSINVAIRNGMFARKRIVRHYRGVDMPHYVFSARKEGSIHAL